MWLSVEITPHKDVFTYDIDIAVYAVRDETDILLVRSLFDEISDALISNLKLLEKEAQKTPVPIDNTNPHVSRPKEGR